MQSKSVLFSPLLAILDEAVIKAALVQTQLLGEYQVILRGWSTISTQLKDKTDAVTETTHPPHGVPGG